MKIEVRNLVKKYPEQVALDNIGFILEDNQILCVLGPSGSGKSTLLRILCGLEEATSGELIYNEQSIEKIDCLKQKISVVFEKPNLIEHLNCFDNIALGLTKLNWPKDKIDKRVKEIAEEVEMSEFLFRKCADLSAGQKQRVALARALVRECDLLLMDEALANLDWKLKKKTLELLLKLKEKYAFSCIYVTHFIDEAEKIENGTMILNEGRIEMLDHYLNCKKNPATDFVKEFLNN